MSNFLSLEVGSHYYAPMKIGFISLILLAFGFSQNLLAQEFLNCELYDLATDQVMASNVLELKSDQRTGFYFEFLGVHAGVMDRLLDSGEREQILFIYNIDGHRETKTHLYSPQGAAERRLPWVTSEIPGYGDTVFFGCGKSFLGPNPFSVMAPL